MSRQMFLIYCLLKKATIGKLMAKLVTNKKINNLERTNIVVRINMLTEL